MGEAEEGFGYCDAISDGLGGCINGFLGGRNGCAGWSCREVWGTDVLREFKEECDGECGGVVEAVIDQERGEEGGDTEEGDVGCAGGR